MSSPRPRLPPLAIPAEALVEQWLDRFDSSPAEDHVEYSLNLGAESPVPAEDDALLPALPLQRNFARRPRPAARKAETLDRDCGICFEYAVQPIRTLCCGKIFCREHITDWLSGPSSDGRCPSCSAPASPTNTLPLTPLITPAVPQAPRVVITTAPSHSSPRLRSQSESTNNSSISSMTTTSASSVSSSTLCLSPALENHSDQPWLSALMDMYHPRSASPSSPTPPQSPDDSAHPRSSTVEALSRLVSVLGLTVLFYALLASS